MRAYRWRLCTILVSAPVLAAAVSWFAIDWSGEGCDVYPGGAVIRDSAGNVMRVTLGEGDVDCRPYYRADPDDWIVKALVAAEDGTFFSHCGVRPLSILRAAAQNIAGGRRVSGASTITMQTVRLISPHRKTYFQKWVEAVRALKMERKKDKLWILSQYLNRAPFGSNFVGIEAASHGWFGKDVKDLGIGEAALLAGMVQAPSRFRPDRGYERALKRRDYVLERMVRLGYITEEESESARTVRPELCRDPRPFRHPYYCDWWVAENACTGGDHTTPLDENVQTLCDNAVDAAAEAGGYSAAAAVMRTGSGEVVALACSGDYFSQDAGQVNTALAPRPAGSTLKPFLAALALDRKIVSPDEMLLDVPRTFNGYSPANFDGRYRGRASLKDSLVLSLNIPFVTMLQQTGTDNFASLLSSLGFSGAATPDGYGLGLAVGNMETTLMELLRAYRSFALAASGKGGGKVSAEAAYLVSSYLSGDERSRAALGHGAEVVLPKFAWKTGTSSGYRDAWTVMWNPEWVVAVWCGHKKGNFGDISIAGIKSAAPLAWKIARGICPGNGGWFRRPDGLKDCDVCALTGLAAGADCPRARRGTCLNGRPARTLCRVHLRSPGGSVAKTGDGGGSPDYPEGGRTLEIAKPRAGTVFKRIGVSLEQKVACKAAGIREGEELWWFLDGKYAGRTQGAQTLFLDMSPGAHALSCADASGRAAETHYTVE